MNQIIEHLYQEELYHITSKILVVVNRPWHEILDTDKALLAKILGSVRVNIDAIGIVERSEIDIEALASLSPEKILVFGSSVKGSIKDYEHTSVQGVSVIRADELSKLDDARKKSLWLALRQMFGV